MDNLNSPHLNSPLLHDRTPVKRLGLSRKRKSFSSPLASINKIIKTTGDEFSSVHESRVYAEEKENIQLKSNEVPDKSEPNNLQTVNTGDKEEIHLVEKRIEQKLELLSDLKSKHGKLVELKNLVDLWKNGCKNAFLHLNHLMEEKQNENLTPKIWLKHLGIWKVMVDTFQDDSELSLSDDYE